jgi:hypothetical protein
MNHSIIFNNNIYYNWNNNLHNKFKLIFNIYNLNNKSIKYIKLYLNKFIYILNLLTEFNDITFINDNDFYYINKYIHLFNIDDFNILLDNLNDLLFFIDYYLDINYINNLDIINISIYQQDLSYNLSNLYIT